MLHRSPPVPTVPLMERTRVAPETDLLTHNPWVPRRPISVVEYHRMGEAGILTEDDRVELIEGQLVPMAPIGQDHAATANALTRLLVLAVGNRGVVTVGNPVRLDGSSEPQPDLTVLKFRADDYRTVVPRAEDVLLLVEISNSSLRYDRTIKLPLYARRFVPEVWIINLAAREIEVHRQPEGDRYAETETVAADGALKPALLPGVTITAASLLG